MNNENAPSIRLHSYDMKTILDALHIAGAMHDAAVSTLGENPRDHNDRYEELRDRLTLGQDGETEPAPVAPHSWSSPLPAYTYALRAVRLTVDTTDTAADYSDSPSRPHMLRETAQPITDDFFNTTQEPTR